MKAKTQDDVSQTLCPMMLAIGATCVGERCAAFILHERPDRMNPGGEHLEWWTCGMVPGKDHQP